MSAQNNLTLDQGTDFTYNINLIDSAGVAVDISNFTANAQLRTSYTSYTTSTLKASRYLYDLILISNNNITSRLMEGTITVNPEVTR